MSVFFDMFVPSRRHVEEERNRQEWTRDEEGEGDPHRGPIDLDSGVVAIRATGEPAAGPDPSAPDLSATTSTVTRQAASQIRHSEP
jgi:hypothetical protein